MMANLAKEQMPLPRTLGAPRFNGVDVTRFLTLYKSISCRTGTNPDQEDIVDIFPYYCAADLQKMVKMISGYNDHDWPILKTQLKDRFCHSDSRVFMYTQTFLAKLCQDQRNRGDVGLKAFVMTYDNVSSTRFVNGSLAEYTRAGSLMTVLPRSLKATAVVRLDSDPQ